MTLLLVEGRPMTLNPPDVLLEPEDLLRMPDGERYELIDGTPKELSVGAESNEIAGLLLTAFNNFIRPARLGRAYPAQTGFQCFPGRPNHVRFPDVAFVDAARVPNGRSPQGYYRVHPDLAVEVVSPNDVYTDIEQRVSDYRSAGTRLTWVIDPATKSVLIRRLDRSCAELGETGTLSGEDVIPGFTCPVAELFV
jgi:Uma2 family endonuclease